MTTIEYKINNPISTSSIIEVFINSGISRPIVDLARIEKMFNNSNLIVSAWEGDKLIGVSRSLTDFSYCCYLSDLAVRKEYRNTGIGKRMIEITKKEIGEKVMLLLLSAPNAMEYYTKVGFEKVQNGFIIKRKS